MAAQPQTAIKPLDGDTLRVSSSPLVRLYNLDEFWALPEPADYSKLELIRGVLYMSPPPTSEHDSLVSHLTELLLDELKRLGMPGSLFFPRAGIYTYFPDSWLEPDLFYLSKASMEYFSNRPRTRADLVIEILSPSTAQYDRTTKADSYAALGVGEMWLIDGEARTVEVRGGGSLAGWQTTRKYSADETLESDVVPGLTLAIGALFAS
jgi:Uma2 family endonuclease